MDKTILIVEDSPTIRYQVRTILRESGFIIREAGSEFGLLNLIEEYGILADLIIMDITLKTDNGFDLIAKLKENEKYKKIPIIILTEHADLTYVVTAKKLGVEGYIRKPFNKDTLLAKIQEVIQ